MQLRLYLYSLFPISFLFNNATNNATSRSNTIPFEPAERKVSEILEEVAQLSSQRRVSDDTVDRLMAPGQVLQLCIRGIRRWRQDGHAGSNLWRRKKS